MSNFFRFFFEEALDGEETAVCCPFPHSTQSGIEYLETTPSAHINIKKGVFHCKVCGEGQSEVSFIAQLFGCSYENATRIQTQFKDIELAEDWIRLNELDDKMKLFANGLGISDEVIEELGIRSESPGTLSFPTELYDKLVDVRRYNPGGSPKVKGRRGSITGMVMPHKLLRNTSKSKWVLICAGEKDMAVARSNGFSAVTITGGERAIPKDLNLFKDRKIAIVYDNDDAGKAGARHLATVLKPIAQIVKVVEGFHDVCSQKGEDITDFFTKYDGTKRELINYIKQANPFDDEEMQKVLDKLYPTLNLRTASKPQHVNRIVQSNVQVVATYESTFIAPTTIVAKKINVKGDSDTMVAGETKEWHLTETTAKDLLKLVDNNFTEKQIRDNTRDIMHIPRKEPSVKMERPTKETIFKCMVTDVVESSDDKTKPMEYLAYSIGVKLESGKKYHVQHKLVPHPYKGQQLVMIIMDVKDSTDSVTNFKVNETAKRNLEIIRELPGSVEDRLNNLVDRAKSFVGYNVNSSLLLTIDLAYNTVLKFDFGNFSNVRGYLDTLVVTESRVGKSSVNDALRDLYKLGYTTSLAGGSATIAGLIGGSNKMGNGQYQTKAGIIPQNHLGLITFEELAKCTGDVLREMTDIKSSNKVRITRVSGSIELPAYVRMITLSNTKTVNGVTQPIQAYPNGIEILTDLIGAAEDIARFDVMYILGDKGSNTIDPLWEPETAFHPDVYRTRIRWIWSRTPEQIKMSKEVTHYIYNECNKLNEEYDSHIKIFGTEAWKKVSRLAIAIAGYLVSTDESYQNIIVSKEHVDYAIEFYKRTYDNPTFKFKQYVENERSYNVIDEDGLSLLQDLFVFKPSLLLSLEQSSVSNRQALLAASGMKQDEFSKVMERMVRGKFVRFKGYNIVPTQRFRQGMNKIDRNIRVSKVGELDV